MTKKTRISVILCTMLINTLLLGGCYQRNNDMPMAQLPSHPIRVVKTRQEGWVAVPSRCPVVHDQFGNLDLSKNLGCATQYNLAKMIANPTDLLPKNRQYKATASPMISQYQRYKADRANVNSSGDESNTVASLQNLSNSAVSATTR